MRTLPGGKPVFQAWSGTYSAPLYLDGRGDVENTGFSSASIQYGPNVSGGPFLYNADDITVAVKTGIPAPGTLVLLLSSVPALLLRRGRRV